MEQAEAYSAFISYASQDREKAFEVCRLLEDRRMRCWIAPRNVRAGREYANEIVNGIERSASFVLIFSENANQSGFVRREVERAVSKNKSIFPVRIENALPSAGLEFFVSSSHWVDAWQGDFAAQISFLARDLADGLPGTVAPAEVRNHPALDRGPAIAPPRPKSSRLGLFSGPNRNLVIGGVAALVLALAIGLYYATRTPSPEELQDRATWQQAALADSIGGYETYQRLYPEGRHMRDAQKRIAALQARAAEDAARREAQQILTQLGYNAGRFGDVGGEPFKTALTRFKRDNGLRANDDVDSDVIEKMRLIAQNEAPVRQAYGQATGQRTRTAYDAFLAQYPSGRYADDIKTRLQSCRTMTVPTRETQNEQVQAQGDASGQGGYSCQAAEAMARQNLMGACSGGRLAQLRVTSKQNVARDVAAGVASGLMNSFLSGGRNTGASNASTSCAATATATCTRAVSGSAQKEVCN